MVKSNAGRRWIRSDDFRKKPKFSFKLKYNQKKTKPKTEWTRKKQMQPWKKQKTGNCLCSSWKRKLWTRRCSTFSLCSLGRQTRKKSQRSFKELHHFSDDNSNCKLHLNVFKDVQTLHHLANKQKIHDDDFFKKNRNWK